jgi:hypothetical protein
MSAVRDLMKEYYSDKKSHPWHNIYKDIEKSWLKVHPKKDVTDTLILLRDAVFGGLEILSLSIALDVPTSEMVSLFTKETTWKEGRRKIRNRCIELVEELTKKRKTRYLVPTALRRDGFGFLIQGIEDAELESYKRAKPKMKKVPKKKKQILDLGSLEKCLLGSRFLREQMVMDTQIEKGDPRISTILEAYDQFLIELEIDMSASIPEPVPTEQVTLNGTPLADVDEEKIEPSKKPRRKSVQSPLIDFIDEKPATKKKKIPKKPSGKKKRRAKKK